MTHQSSNAFLTWLLARVANDLSTVESSTTRWDTSGINEPESTVWRVAWRMSDSACNYHMVSSMALTTAALSFSLTASLFQRRAVTKKVFHCRINLFVGDKEEMVGESTNLLAIIDYIGGRVGTPSPAILASTSRQISISYPCSLSNRLLSMSDSPSKCTVASASAIFSSSSISDEGRWSVFEGPGWSILVVACA